MSQTNYSKNLSADIKWKIAEDFGIGYDKRHEFFDENPEFLLDCLLKNMDKGDRNRAVMDLLLSIEEAERTQHIIEANNRMISLTGWMAGATLLLAFIEFCRIIITQQ